MSHCVIFTLTLSDESDINVFLAAFKSLRTYCQGNEPGTLMYELYTDQHQPGRFSVVERYVSKDDVDSHTASPAFMNFMALLDTLQVKEKSLTILHNTDVAARLRGISEKAYVHAEASAAAPIGIRQKKGILIFGGSRPGARPSYVASAAEVGTYIALKAKVPLVYGGGTDGIMGAVARAVKENGGEVVSVIPRSLVPREAKGGEKEFADIVYMTETMSERKSVMFAHSNTVVILPGGLGTFDELYETLTLLQLNAHCPKIGIINTDGFFDPFLANLRHMIQEGFVEAFAMNYFIVGSPQEVMTGLESFNVPSARTLQWDTRP